MSRLSAWERRTGPALTGLAVLSLVGLVLEATWAASTASVRVVDSLAWAVFAADYVVRLVLAERRWRFVRSHPIDLIAVAVPPVRSLRLIAAIARVATAARRGLASRVLATTSLLSATVVVAGAAAALDAERDAPEASITTYGEALWWAVTTVTTVGYGDRYPVTVEGRIVAALLMVVGIATFGGITAAVAANVIEQDAREESAQAPAPDVAARLAELEAAVTRLTTALEQRRAPPDQARPGAVPTPPGT